MYKRFNSLLIGIALLGAATSASAQSGVGFQGFGGRLSFVNLGDAEETGPLYDLGSAFGISAVADLGHVTPRIGIEAHLSYWSLSDGVQVQGLSPSNPFVSHQYNASWTVRDIIIGGRGKYEFTVTNPKVTPYAGAGLGLHFAKVSFSTNAPDAPRIGQSETHLGLDVGGGIDYKLSPSLSLVGDMWYTITDVNQLAISAGLIFGIGGMGN